MDFANKSAFFSATTDGTFIAALMIEIRTCKAIGSNKGLEKGEETRRCIAGLTN